MPNTDDLNRDHWILNFREGRFENYFQSFLKEFGGTLEDNRYQVDNDQVFLKATRYTLAESLDMTLMTYESERKLSVYREADKDPDLLHLNLVSRGGYHQSFTGQNTTVDHQTSRGAFLYNSLFPISVEFDPNRRVDMIFFKFRASRIGELFQDSARVFGDLFEDDTPLSYHSTIGHRLNKLIVDLFKANDDTFDREALVLYRGMEIFSKMSASLDNLKSRDELNGLHPEDYNRLQRIKSELLSNFEEKTSITELAEHHGVSVSKLKRDFKSLFGMSVYRFYNHSRMDEAYRRLSSGEYSVTEVGYDLGYSNLSKFSEMFKRMKGISPSQALP